MQQLSPDLFAHLLEGTVIPAHPLALDASRNLSEKHQRALTRYYISAGAGGIAVGVHTTQFDIRNPEKPLYEQVLRLAAEEVDRANLARPFLKIAGVSGNTPEAVAEAQIAKELGYDMVLVSSNGLGNWEEWALLERARAIGEVMPLFGFYLQPAVGGRVLSLDFWRQFAEIPTVQAIKIAPFNRYQTLEVVRGICQSGRADEIALYTGNDDNIILDLLTTYQVKVNGAVVEKQIVGGLLGHWAVWTRTAVDHFQRIKSLRENRGAIPPQMLTLNIAITDANAAFFDASNDFKGCIAGLHEVLRRQGLIEGLWCLDPEEGLSPGQLEEIDRVYTDYPDLNDDSFVERNLGKWFAE